MGEHSAKVEAGDQVFSDAYFCRRIASPKSLLYESGCLN